MIYLHYMCSIFVHVVHTDTKQKVKHSDMLIQCCMHSAQTSHSHIPFPIRVQPLTPSMKEYTNKHNKPTHSFDNVTNAASTPQDSSKQPMSSNGAPSDDPCGCHSSY